jgi:prepilin-type N-terminal cleavage/methylation domain-containing protein
MYKLYFSDDGFSLIEVLVSILIFGIFGVIMLNLFGSSFIRIISSGQKDQSVSEIANQFEKIYRHSSELPNPEEEINENNIQKWIDTGQADIIHNVENDEGETIGYILKISNMYNNKKIELTTFIRKE